MVTCRLPDRGWLWCYEISKSFSRPPLNMYIQHSGCGLLLCRAPIIFMFESGLTDRGAALDASHKNSARSQRSRDDYHEPQIYPIGGARAFVSCCFACGCVLEFVVCRVRFACVSCPRLRFEGPTPLLTPEY